MSVDHQMDETFPASTTNDAAPSFGYHPDVECLRVALDSGTFSRALVLDYPVRGLVDQVDECRVLWHPDVALPEGIYWFDGIEGSLVMQVAIGCASGRCHNRASRYIRRQPPPDGGMGMGGGAMGARRRWCPPPSSRSTTLPSPIQVTSMSRSATASSSATTGRIR